MVEKLELVYSLNLAASCLSLFGSVALIINFFLFANKAQPLYKLIFSLSLSDFGLSVTMIVSQILLFFHQYDDGTYSRPTCVVLRALINFFFLASFLWTASISLHMFISFRQRAQIPLRYYLLVCWGVPLIAFIVLLSDKHLIDLFSV